MSTGNPEPTGTEWHYVLTAQHPHPQGMQIGTGHGTLILGPEATRARALEYVRRALRESMRWPSDGEVLFFCLEPNQIGS